MNFTRNTLPIALIAAAMFFTAILLFSGVGVSTASAPSGLPATQQIATTTIIGPQQTKTLFASNPSCASRIIRTQGVEIYIAFADPTNGDLASTTLSAVAGFVQGASTTVAYDSGIYGCGRMTAEALSSTTITISEM